MLLNTNRLHHQLIVDGSNSGDSPQGFLGQLLFKPAVDFAFQNDMPSNGVAEMDFPLVEMGVMDHDRLDLVPQVIENDFGILHDFDPLRER